MRPFPVEEWEAGSPHALSCSAGRAPTSLGRAHLPSQAGGPGAPHCWQGAVPVRGPCWMHECGCCICLWFVRWGVPICLCVHISGNKALHTQLGCSGWELGIGGAAAHHCFHMPTGPSPPSINSFISLVWHKWNRHCPALQGHRIRPLHPHSWAHRPPAPPVSACPGLRAQWCRWRGCGSPPPCQGLGRLGDPRAPSRGLQRAPGEGPGSAPRPGAGCRATTAHGARGSS